MEVVCEVRLGRKGVPDTTLLTTFTTGPFLVHTTKVARTLDEIRALKLRVAGASVPIAKALGMSVAVLPATDAYGHYSGAPLTARYSLGGGQELPSCRAA